MQDYSQISLHPAANPFYLLDNYKQKVLDFQKDKCHHLLQLWI